MPLHAWATIRFIVPTATDQKVEAEDAAACIMDWAHEKLGWNGATEAQIREVLRQFQAFVNQKRPDETDV